MSYIKRETEDTYVSYTCRFCGNAASAETLSMLGARCGRCYEVYCKEPVEVRKYPESLPTGHLAWAHRLKWREGQGEKLSKIQTDSYKLALRIQ